MSRLTRKEFAALCHTSVSVINVNVARGNLIVDRRKIDTTEPSNRDFFNRYQKKFEDQRKKENKPKPEPKPEPPQSEFSDPKISSYAKKKPAKKNNKVNSESDDQKDKVRDASNDYVIRKKKADALKSEREAEKLLLQVRKMSGEMIPTDMVQLIIKQMAQSIFSSFSSENEKLASWYCEIMAGGDRKYLSEINDKLDNELQEIINKTKETAKKDISNVIKQFADTRGRGERK